MAAVSSSMDANNLMKMLVCPVELEPLTTAVNLIPCGHTINAAVAEKLYGIMQNQSFVEKQEKTCPECRTIVKAYYPDYKIREIASMICSPVAAKKKSLLEVEDLLLEIRDSFEEKENSLPVERSLRQRSISVLSGRLTPLRSDTPYMGWFGGFSSLLGFGGNLPL